MVALAALLLSLTSPPATVAERIAHGRASLENLDYDAAALELTMAAQDKAASDAERIEANLYAGIAYRILGRDTDARLCFVYVLKHDPAAQLPADASPKLTTFFELVREELAVSTTNATPPRASTPPTPPTSTTAPAGPSPTASPSGWLYGAGVGVVVAVAGAAVGIAGSVPYYQHAAAHDGLVAAEAAGTSGAALQAEQRDARAAWESWGVWASSIGLSVAGAGAAVAIGSGVAWALE